MVPWDRPQFCTPAKLLLVDFSAPAIHGSAKKLDIPRHHVVRPGRKQRSLRRA
jgi:hypothetical protein